MGVRTRERCVHPSAALPGKRAGRDPGTPRRPPKPAIANVSATAAILLALGVHKDAAINFGLASGLLLCGTAAVAAIVGVAASVAIGVRVHLADRVAT